jgi:hypothetical protein
MEIELPPPGTVPIPGCHILAEFRHLPAPHVGQSAFELSMETSDRKGVKSALGLYWISANAEWK